LNINFLFLQGAITNIAINNYSNMKKQNQNNAFVGIAVVGVVAVAGLVSMTSAAPVLAKSTSTTTATAAQITCVGKAVSSRELAFDGAENSYQSAEGAAYAARLKALTAAYNTGTSAGVSSGIKTAWATFDAATKTATATWATKRLTLWTSFKTAAAECKAPAAIIDLAK
jgi:hypothetical protein